VVGLHEEGPRYRGLLNWLGEAGNGERTLARSDQYFRRLRRKIVSAAEDSNPA